MVMSPVMQMLQPMHSRMSSMPTFLDLLRQEGIGDGGPRAADEVERAGLDHAYHHVRRGEAAHTDDRARRQLLDARNEVLLRGFLLEARRAGAILPGAVGQIPEIGE